MQRRLTEAEDSQLRRVWNILGEIADPCEEIGKMRRAMWEMVAQCTTDGRPYVEPPLTDEDAQKRAIVMVRNGEKEPWLGPGTLAFCLDCTPKYLVVWPQKDWSKKGVYDCWRFTRRATPIEIAASGLEVTE